MREKELLYLTDEDFELIGAANYRPKRDCRRTNASNSRATPEPDRTTSKFSLLYLKISSSL